MADAEERYPSISVGGPTVHLGLHCQQREPAILATVNAATALPKLVELWRRQQGLTVEEFAKWSYMTEAEVVGIGSGEIVPKPRVIFQVSRSFLSPTTSYCT